jgi:molybdenum cofactor cytidylyltransferase
VENEIDMKISNSNKNTFFISNKSFKITGLVITAGLSQRMGSFKPLLKYNKISFLENIIQKLNLICDEIIIVTGFNSEEIFNKLENISNDFAQKLKIVHNVNYEMGMFTSLQKGLENCNSDYIIYHFVDQPNIPNEFYTNFVNQINLDYDWIQPQYKGQNGHPIIFSKKVSEKIIFSSQNSNLRIVSASKEINKYFWECNSEEILTDIDTPKDYELLKDLK